MLSGKAAAATKPTALGSLLQAAGEVGGAVVEDGYELPPSMATTRRHLCSGPGLIPATKLRPIPGAD